MKNIYISIDDVIGVVENAKRNLIFDAQDARRKVREAASNTGTKHLWTHHAECHEQSAQRLQPLIEKLNDIHELGYDFIGGVGEREVV